MDLGVSQKEHMKDCKVKTIPDAEATLVHQAQKYQN